MCKRTKTLSRRARKTKGPCRPGYARYRKVSTMRDNRAHVGRWKRLRHASGTLEKRMGNQKMCGATRRRGGRKESLVDGDGDVVAVVVVGGVVAKVRVTLLQQTVTHGLRRPPEQRPTAESWM